MFSRKFLQKCYTSAWRIASVRERRMGMGNAVVICDIGFGDAGKGTTVDFMSEAESVLCGQPPLIVRYNGGPQAAHNVVTSDGVWHCFAQFGSGSLGPMGARTLLSREMLVELENLVAEGKALQEKGVLQVFENLIIDPRAHVVTPMQKMVCQMSEIGRGTSRFGSCGMGVGETVRDRALGISFTVADIFNPVELRAKVRALREIKLGIAKELLERHPSQEMRDVYEYFENRTRIEPLCALYESLIQDYPFEVETDTNVLHSAALCRVPVIFEGAQGALLDSRFGTTPYVTKTRSTFHNIQDILKQGPELPFTKVGIMRPYAHRHGAGPLPTEDDTLRNVLCDEYNKENRWQGAFRVGWFDLILARYGILINDGVDSLVLTNLDQLSTLSEIKVVTSYEYVGDLKVLKKARECLAWKVLGKERAEIFGFTSKPGLELLENDWLTTVLARSKPKGVLVFSGWQRDISCVEEWRGLPLQTRNYVNFLESEDGLGVPIEIVSVNPRSDGKIVV